MVRAFASSYPSWLWSKVLVNGTFGSFMRWMIQGYKLNAGQLYTLKRYRKIDKYDTLMSMRSRIQI